MLLRAAVFFFYLRKGRWGLQSSQRPFSPWAAGSAAGTCCWSFWSCHLFLCWLAFSSLGCSLLAVAAAEGRSKGYRAKHCRASCCKSRSSLRDFGSSDVLPAQLKQQLLLPVSLANKCYQVAAPPAMAGSLGTWPPWEGRSFVLSQFKHPWMWTVKRFFSAGARPPARELHNATVKKSVLRQAHATQGPDVRRLCVSPASAYC